MANKEKSADERAEAERGVISIQQRRRVDGWMEGKERRKGEKKERRKERRKERGEGGIASTGRISLLKKMPGFLGAAPLSFALLGARRIRGRAARNGQAAGTASSNQGKKMRPRH